MPEPTGKDGKIRNCYAHFDLFNCLLKLLSENPDMKCQIYHVLPDEKKSSHFRVPIKIFMLHYYDILYRNC